MKKATFFLLVLLSSVFNAFSQCPMCKASVESSQSSNVKSVGMGLNTGILMLLVSVYIIVFFIGIMWYRKYRRNQFSENAF